MCPPTPPLQSGSSPPRAPEPAHAFPFICCGEIANRITGSPLHSIVCLQGIVLLSIRHLFLHHIERQRCSSEIRGRHKGNIVTPALYCACSTCSVACQTVLFGSPFVGQRLHATLPTGMAAVRLFLAAINDSGPFLPTRVCVSTSVFTR